jgi:hypothetical protein
MSIFDVFKLKWSAKFMSQDDRRKIFWYLKRTSSYTAWKARADAFDRFAAVVERQVREEPIIMPNPAHPEWATNWEHFYIEILKGQVLYEQGLSRLRQGDRSVWRYNDRGVLLDAKNIHGHWWDALVNHGPHGDIYFRGKYVDEMTSVIDDPSLKATAGVVQSVLAEPPAVHLWSPEFIARLDRQVPFPPVLPDVPITDKAINVRTGEPVPCFGIYEPLVEDGCMNYLLEGAPTPKAVNRGAVIRPAVWRLIWEDTRYLDGSIPQEEDLYFRPEEPAEAAPAGHVGTEPIISLESNQRVSRQGVWVVDQRLDVRERFELGDTLPQHEGRDVLWLWVSKQ